MSTETAYIDDGYTLDAVVAAAPGVHPEVRLAYRPCTHDQRNRYLKASADPDKRAAAAAELVAKHVQSWDLKKRDGADVPVAKESALRVQPLLLDKVVDLLCGYAGSAEEEEADRKNS
jgi:hypothetical protein